ncbi:MAG: ABC transporter ATP-binding protein/permease [Defluviitaleaceae bacterium]|nr:ABC transporter ATP-binding protein/permease [Defluviitaleaceae bacterium]
MSLLFTTLNKHRQRYKGLLTIYLVLALITAVAGAFMTRFTGDLGQAAYYGEVSTILRFLGIVTIIMVIQAVAAAVTALILGRFAARAGYRFRDNFARYFLQKPFAAFETTTSGESLSAFTNDLPEAVQLVSNGGIRMLGDILSLLVSFVFLLTINWWLTLVFFASFPVLIVLQVLASVPIQKQSARRLEAQGKVNSVINDSFQNTSTVAAYSLENEMERRIQDTYVSFIDATRAHVRAFLGLVLIGQIASFTPLIIIIAISAFRVVEGNMSIAEFIAFTGLAAESGSWLAMLSQRQNEVQTAAGGAKRLGELMVAEPENIEIGAISESLTDESEIAVAMENLTFSYVEDEEVPPTLNEVSFEIKKGSRVAFIGGSGSGKSTILKLLMGLYTQRSGNIKLLGHNASDICLRALRESFAYVPQDSFLFPETIAQNITGEKDITDEKRLTTACRNAGIMDFIESLPNGFDSELGESAENISGGQKQRIALARAFYKDAPIILFDEATSALDPATESEILTTFDSHTQDKTVVMVAHRLRAIGFCDIIAVLDKGRLVSKGTHTELYNSCPVYTNLYDSQQKEAQS